MSRLFISHSSVDGAFVRELQQALGEHGQDVWIDSRQLRGGDLLWQKIKEAIEEASAYAVVVSPASLQSKWVGKELRHALAIQKVRGDEVFPVIPVSLDETHLGVLEEFFDGEPVYIPISSAPGGIRPAVRGIFAALRRDLPALWFDPEALFYDIPLGAVSPGRFCSRPGRLRRAPTFSPPASRAPNGVPCSASPPPWAACPWSWSRQRLSWRKPA